jgi:hypothetical protein
MIGRENLRSDEDPSAWPLASASVATADMARLRKTYATFDVMLLKQGLEKRLVDLDRSWQKH